MKLCVLVAGNSGSLCIIMGLCSSFSFGVVKHFTPQILIPIQMYSGEETLNAHNSLLKCAMQLKQVSFNFSFRLPSYGLLFSTHFFGPPKKTLDYSLWFLQNFDETMTSPKRCRKHIKKEQNDACFSVVASSSEE